MSDPIYTAQALEIANMAEHIKKLKGLVGQYHSAMRCMLETGTWPTDPAYLEDQMQELGIEVDDGCTSERYECEFKRVNELMVEMYEFIHDVCKLHPYVLTNAHIPEWQIANHSTPAERYAEKMRELGIEVPHD